MARRRLPLVVVMLLGAAAGVHGQTHPPELDAIFKAPTSNTTPSCGISRSSDGDPSCSLTATRRPQVNSTVATHLMFSGNASPAMELYGSVFPEFRVERIERYGAGE